MSAVDDRQAQAGSGPAYTAIDRALSRRVLLYGSLPPHGRDLDLLARAPERRAIEARLAAAGFCTREDQWARFADCSVEVVELADPASWDLPEQELEDLFEEGRPLEGCEQLVRPAPHHSLLILARRLAASAEGALDAKRRARVEQSCSEDARVWELARERAGHWQAQATLEALEHLHRHGAVPAHLLSAAREEGRKRRRKARPAPRRWVSAGRQALRRTPARGRVVALSGLDGAGKSSQAAHLQQTLERLGFDAVVVRTRISWEDWLWRLVPPVKRAIALPVRAAAAMRSIGRRAASGPPAAPRSAADGSQPGSGAPAAQRSAADGRRLDSLAPAAQPDAMGRTSSTSTEADAVRRLRERSNLLTDAWTVVIALTNVWAQWRLMYRQLARGGIVICDRYTLDSIVAMRYSYGSERPLKPLRATLAALYPKPVRAYFLDVTPATALARKGEWGEEWLTRHRELYLQECPRLGVTVIDGEKPREEVCAQIAREVWLSDI
jgi:thymidylate kinase